MKILHLHTELNKTCGITKTILQLAKDLPSEFQNYVFALGGDNTGLFKKNGVNTIIFEKNKYLVVPIVRKITQICRLEKINILHSHNRYFDFITKMIAIRNNIPRITTVHSKVYGLKQISYRSPYLIAVSDSIKEHLISTFNLSADWITVIHNYVDKKYSAESSKKNDVFNNNKNKIFLFIGRLCKEKGVDILVRAFLKLQNNNSNRDDIFLLIIGAGPMYGSLRSFIQNNKLNAELMLPQEDVSKYYKNAYTVVIPSRVDPFPLVMLEAGAFAKPFIGGAVDGIDEFITDRQEGVKIIPGNVDELFEAMEIMLNEPVFAAEMGMNLQAKVNSECSAKNILPKYIEYYEGVLRSER